MGHPLLEEFCRAKSELRPEFFRRCQRVFREEINPMFEKGVQADAMLAAKDAEIADLRVQLEDLRQKAVRRRKEAEAVSA